ncbi:unnamed protein product [Thlaspi arvense]|uniref:Protein TIC 22, chloroplastic n=1 Tax=Thlaspi arvense TaxID=13288 RepID=A0AAU9T9C3_THLAR|nr:unnamed protein product [Thlaspi arvense]
MASPKPSPNPLLSLSSSVYQHCNRLGAELARGLSGKTRVRPCSELGTGGEDSRRTTLYTVSNSNNEFVLISDPNSLKSIGLLCFRQEDAEAFLAQVQSRKRELRSKAKVVPITLDQVYSLKVEGIAFRFLPDPIQIKNALELKASDIKGGFDGVPVFQSDLLVVRKRNRRYCPIYFCKEDIEKELSTVSRASRGPGVSQHIMVGSLENVLKKMEMSEKNSGWEDLIFIPPGKSHSQHFQEVVNA